MIWTVARWAWMYRFRNLSTRRNPTSWGCRCWYKIFFSFAAVRFQYARSSTSKTKGDRVIFNLMADVFAFPVYTTQRPATRDLLSPDYYLPLAQSGLEQKCNSLYWTHLPRKRLNLCTGLYTHRAELIIARIPCIVSSSVSGRPVEQWFSKFWPNVSFENRKFFFVSDRVSISEKFGCNTQFKIAEWHRIGSLLVSIRGTIRNLCQNKKSRNMRYFLFRPTDYHTADLHIYDIFFDKMPPFCF